MEPEGVSNPQSAIRNPQSRRWIWYFVVLAVLSMVSVGMLIAFNLGQQLRPEQVEAARALWEENKPRDYRLQWSKKGNSTATYVVWVRNGRVQAVIEKQDEKADDQQGRRLEPRLYADYDMPALFGFLETFLEMDRKPGSPRAFNKGTFDPEDGHLLHYVRSVMGKGERIEITNVKLQPEPAGTPIPSFLWRDIRDKK
jgi:hypothetical protein